MAIRKKSIEEINDEVIEDAAEELENSDVVVVDYTKKDQKDFESNKLITIKDAHPEVINYLKGIGSEHVLEAGLTKTQYEKLKDAIRIHSLGIGSNIVRNCSEDCESWSRCPLAIIKKAPIGRACPVEIDLYEKLMIEYKNAVVQKINTIKSVEDIEKDPVILSLISQVVEIEIMSFRTNAMIATVGLTMAVPVLATDEGPEFSLQESVASKLKRDLNNRRDKILRQLLATPEMVQRIRTMNLESSSSSQKKRILNEARLLIAEKTLEDDEIDSKDEADIAKKALD